MLLSVFRSRLSIFTDLEFLEGCSILTILYFLDESENFDESQNRIEQMGRRS